MTRLAQIAQRAEDLGRAAAFYEMLLGAPPLARFEPPGLVFFDLGGTRLLVEQGASAAMIYLAVPDVRIRIEELRAGGVTVVAEPHVIFRHTDDTLGPAGHDEWHAFIKDSEGNLVGLISQLPSS